MQFELPGELPVMTLPNVVFFPQALLPLHIFEPRYREMLRDVLDRYRVFAVAQLDRAAVGKPGRIEPLHRVATAGIIRACQNNENGTSDLLLQGLCRVEVTAILRETPYRAVAARPLFSIAGGSAEELVSLRKRAADLLDLKRKLGLPMPEEITRLVQSVDDPDSFADLSAFALCEDPKMKQRLLETLAVKLRLQLLARYLEREIRVAKLHHGLQGHLPDDQIGRN
jgi:ATP-dependent Lon protease